MAIREIRVVGDRVLTKKCRPVEKMTPRISELIDDMFDTMYEANGVGLAAPQVGILKRIVVMDVDGTPHLLINPEILETSGSQTGAEGCLSLPGKSGTVTRPNYVKVRALDRDMQPFELEGTELLARCICHECDHLDGHMYTKKVEGELWDNTYDEYEEYEERVSLKIKEMTSDESGIYGNPGFRRAVPGGTAGGGPSGMRCVYPAG